MVEESEVNGSLRFRALQKWVADQSLRWLEEEKKETKTFEARRSRRWLSLEELMSMRNAWGHPKAEKWCKKEWTSAPLQRKHPSVRGAVQRLVSINDEEGEVRKSTMERKKEEEEDVKEEDVWMREGVEEAKPEKEKKGAKEKKSPKKGGEKKAEETKKATRSPAALSRRLRCGRVLIFWEGGEGGQGRGTV